MIRSRTALLAVLVLGMAGCGNASDDAPEPGGTPEGSPSARPPLSSTPPPTRLGGRTPPKGPSDQIRPVVVSGRITTSDGCVDLVTSTVRWTLLGAAAQRLEDGAQVEIRGMPAPQLVSPCGDAPMRVLEIRPR